MGALACKCRSGIFDHHFCFSSPGFVSHVDHQFPGKKTDVKTSLLVRKRKQRTPCQHSQAHWPALAVRLLTRQQPHSSGSFPLGPKRPTVGQPPITDSLLLSGDSGPPPCFLHHLLRTLFRHGFNLQTIPAVHGLLGGKKDYNKKKRETAAIQV